MRIAIDARMIRAGNMHGIARYAFNLIEGISRLNLKDLKLFVFISKDSPILDQDLSDNVELVPIRSKWISFYEQWELPQKLKELKIDLFHAPSFVAPIYCPAKLIMTIHDLNHLVLAQYYTPIHQIYYRAIVRKCIQKSSFLFTVSQFSKKELVRTLKIDPDKVVVTYNGVSSHYVRQKNLEYCDFVREKYDLPEEYMLCLANNKPHKNVYQLVKAFCEVSIETPLVLACPPDERLIKLTEAHNKKHLLFFSRYIQEEHLPTVYSMAKLFLFPSTYEGFGLPPLEAMACGTPVVVSEASSLPEVIGDCGIYVNPYDHLSIAKGLEKGLQDQSLREKLIERGLQHVERFKWEAMVEHTINIYRRVLEESYLSKGVKAELKRA